MASARSLLLTVLGEFALPRDEGVWTATAVEALGLLGIDERAARQALARTSAQGLLVTERHGRRTSWSLTSSGRSLLEEGRARIFAFLREPRAWDGRWLVLTVSIPETQRRLRHRLRTRLTWLGLGSPSSGLWVSPDAAQLEPVRTVIEELGLGKHSFAWVGPATGIGDEAGLTGAAWDLEEVEDRYRQLLADFADRRPAGPDEVFTAQVEVVQAWRQFPFLDPALPRELLDHDWPGHRAAELFHDRHAQWHRRAQSEWARMQAAAGRRV